MQKFFTWFNNLYLVWLVGLGVLAFIRPSTMLWFDKPWIFWSLAISMLGMGLTLSVEEFPLSPARGPPTDWTELVQVHDDRDLLQASPDELPAIDIHSL